MFIYKDARLGNPFKSVNSEGKVVNPMQHTLQSIKRCSRKESLFDMCTCHLIQTACTWRSSSDSMPEPNRLSWAIMQDHRGLLTKTHVGESKLSHNWISCSASRVSWTRRSAWPCHESVLSPCQRQEEESDSVSWLSSYWQETNQHEHGVEVSVSSVRWGGTKGRYIHLTSWNDPHPQIHPKKCKPKPRVTNSPADVNRGLSAGLMTF